MSSATIGGISDSDERSARLARWLLPWLLSTTTHVSVMLVLALAIERHRGIEGLEGPNEGIVLSVVQAGGAAEANETSVEIAPPSSDEAGEDVQLASASVAAEAIEPFEVHSEGELAAIEEDLAPVEFDDVAVTPDEDAASAAETESKTPNPRSIFHRGEDRMLAHRDSGSAHGGAATGHSRAGIHAALQRGAARTGVFGVSGVGYKFVYVFDRSGSMDGHGGAPLAAAKAELIESLQHLGKVHQFQIIFYNEHPRIFTLSGNDGRLVFGTEQNKRLAERFVNGIIADGATHHEDALHMALRMNPDVIFFLTDADEPTLNSQQLARVVRMNNGTTINTVEFGYGPQSDGNNFLVKLARQNGGQHVYVDISMLLRQ